MKKDALHKRKPEESWIIIGVCFLVVSVVLGFCSTSKGIFIAPITEGLGISRSAFSLNDSFRYITTAVVNLFFGSLIAQFGAKKLMLAGFCSLILSMLMYSVATNVYVFYIGSILLGMGVAWTTTTMVGYVVNIWCSSNQGTITGAILASNGIGSAIAVQILNPIIYRPGKLLGYQDAYRLVILLLLIVAVVVLLFFKDKPKEPVTVANSAQKRKRGRQWSGIAWSDAVRRVYFYGALVCIFLNGVVLQGITGSSAPLMKDAGLDPSYVAAMVSVTSIALSCFKFFAGFIYDKTGLRFTVSLCMTTAVIVIFALSLVGDSAAGKYIALFYSVFVALALPLETVMLPICTSDLFGQRDYSKILGFVVSANTAGAAIGSPIVNLCYDLTGSYDVALYVGCGLLVTVFVSLQVIISTANREHKAAEERNEIR